MNERKKSDTESTAEMPTFDLKEIRRQASTPPPTPPPPPKRYATTAELRRLGLKEGSDSDPPGAA